MCPTYYYKVAWAAERRGFVPVRIGAQLALAGAWAMGWWQGGASALPIGFFAKPLHQPRLANLSGSEKNTKSRP